MRKFIHNLQQILPLVHNTHLPAFIFALALLGFYLCGDIAEQSMLTLHAAFFCLTSPVPEFSFTSTAANRSYIFWSSV